NTIKPIVIELMDVAPLSEINTEGQTRENPSSPDTHPSSLDRVDTPFQGVDTIYTTLFPENPRGSRCRRSFSACGSIPSGRAPPAWDHPAGITVAKVTAETIRLAKQYILFMSFLFQSLLRLTRDPSSENGQGFILDFGPILG